MLSKKENYDYALVASEEGSERDQSPDVKHRRHTRWNSRALRGAFCLAVGGSLLLNVFQLFIWLYKNDLHGLGDKSTTAYGMCPHQLQDGSLM
jgi:hypothetical protein